MEHQLPFAALARTAHRRNELAAQQGTGEASRQARKTGWKHRRHISTKKDVRIAHPFLIVVCCSTEDESLRRLARFDFSWTPAETDFF